MIWNRAGQWLDGCELLVFLFIAAKQFKLLFKFRIVVTQTWSLIGGAASIGNKSSLGGRLRNEAIMDWLH
jgi:hypothetical protein